MRKVIFILLVGLILFSMPVLAGEQGSIVQHFHPSNIDEIFIGVNPLGIFVNSYLGDLGVVFEGADELHVPFLYNPGFTEQTELMAGLTYRYYPNRQASGWFAGAGPKFTTILNDVHKNYQESSFIFTPMLELGYRAKWGNSTLVLEYRFEQNFSSDELHSGFNKGLFFELGFWFFDPASR